MKPPPRVCRYQDPEHLRHVLQKGGRSTDIVRAHLDGHSLVVIRLVASRGSDDSTHDEDLGPARHRHMELAFLELGIATDNVRPVLVVVAGSNHTPAATNARATVRSL